tara:strand:+ start:237 stop:482 length:246 start_codon:yes stop_codon:yes gene_type:complete
MMGKEGKVDDKAGVAVKRLSQTLQRRQLMLNIKKLQLQRRTVQANAKGGGKGSQVQTDMMMHKEMVSFKQFTDDGGLTYYV